MHRRNYVQLGEDNREALQKLRGRGTTSLRPATSVMWRKPRRMRSRPPDWYHARVMDTIVSRLAARTDRSVVETRHFKWPHRPQASSLTCLLGDDRYGYWLGAAKGDPWWSADGRKSGVFTESIVKLVPPNAYWSVCFRSVDPVVDIDIVLPPSLHSAVLEEVDLELDVLLMADGTVYVRDEDEFERVRTIWPMPPDLVSAAHETCAWVRDQLESRKEPFAQVGFTWLEWFEVEVAGV